jgi:hypothetical protein
MQCKRRGKCPIAYGARWQPFKSRNARASHFSLLTPYASLPAGQSQLLSAALHSLENDLNVLFQRNA